MAIGAGLTIGYSVPGKIETNVASPIGKPGFGINSSLRYQLNDIFAFYTGLNIVRKPFTIRHDEYDFPDLSHTGHFKVGMSNTFIQIPLLLSGSLCVSDLRFFEIVAGINASRMKPKELVATNDWAPIYNGNGTLKYSFTGDNDKIDYNTKYGLELNIGLAYNFKLGDKSKKMQRIALGLERTFFSGPRITYDVLLSNDTDEKKYSISENPILWFFKIEYMYFFFSR